MIDYDPTVPKWRQIADILRRRIADGTYPPRHKLSEVRLEQEFGVSRGTIRRVVAVLRSEGLLVTTPGLGSFVAARDQE